jgi:hypothetical protein
MTWKMIHINTSIRYGIHRCGLYTYNYLNHEYTCSKFESNNDENVTCDREATRLMMSEDVWETITVLSVTETRNRDVTLQS